MTELKQYRITATSAAELVTRIEAGVATGALVPGQSLPSVRRLAADVGLSPVTVASAIAELRRRGVVLSEPRRGTRIGSAPPLGSPRPHLPIPAGARDLSLGNPDPELLPDLGGVLSRRELPTHLYGEPQALEELVEIARQRLRADGIPCEHLCVASGAMDAIERVLQAHLRTGDRVAVENPGYASLYDLLRAYGLALEPVAVDDRGMDPDELERALHRGALAAVVTPRGQNPRGGALDADRARALRAVLERYPRTLLIEDDHLGEVAGTPLHALVSDRARPCERWAATRSVAKALGPDLRLAVLAGDATTIARVQGRQQCGPGWVSHILQTLVLALWRDRAVHALVARASATYVERREHLLACLARQGVRAHGASGLNVWIPVHEETGAIGALMQRGWVLAPGAPYRLPGAGPGVRVTTTTLAHHEAERLAGDLAEVLAPSVLSRSG
jgi:DNA-binding transcriptional MocR family regulator